MASAGRKLAWAALGAYSLYILAAACSGGDVERDTSCEALDALGVEIASYQELLVWPGITAASLLEGTDKLETAVLQLANSSGDQYTTDIIEAFTLVDDAAEETVPPSLAELRPGEPVQMAAAFISVELQPLIDARARALSERC